MRWHGQTTLTYPRDCQHNMPRSPLNCMHGSSPSPNPPSQYVHARSTTFLWQSFVLGCAHPPLVPCALLHGPSTHAPAYITSRLSCLQTMNVWASSTLDDFSLSQTNIYMCAADSTLSRAAIWCWQAPFSLLQASSWPNSSWQQTSHPLSFLKASLSLQVCYCSSTLQGAASPPPQTPPLQPPATVLYPSTD